jgi:hypothetical protein
LNVTFLDLVACDLDLVFIFVLLFDFEPDVIFIYLRCCLRLYFCLFLRVREFLEYLLFLVFVMDALGEPPPRVLPFGLLLLPLLGFMPGLGALLELLPGLGGLIGLGALLELLPGLGGLIGLGALLELLPGLGALPLPLLGLAPLSLLGRRGKADAGGGGSKADAGGGKTARIT